MPLKPQMKIHMKLRLQSLYVLSIMIIILLILFYSLLPEGPGVARGKRRIQKKKKFENKKLFFFNLKHLRKPLSVLKKIQLIRSSGLAGYG